MRNKNRKSKALKVDGFYRMTQNGRMKTRWTVSDNRATSSNSPNLLNATFSPAESLPHINRLYRILLSKQNHDSKLQFLQLLIHERTQI